jgi:hypothetical protein
MTRRLIAIGALGCALTGCGYYPEPFVGHPGVMGARLAVPPPPILAVPPPERAMLTQSDSTVLAKDLAKALAASDVPAIAEPAAKADWRLDVTADLVSGDPRNPMVAVTYTVRNPHGIAQGSTTAAPVSAATWSMAAPVALDLVARRDAPRIAALLTRIEAAVQLSDPNSLVNRPPRIDFLGVTGAPGDGNISLAKSIAGDLGTEGLVVQDTQSGADFALKGTVTTAPAPDHQTRVEILWTVADLYGREVGHLVQMNDVPQGALNGYWGDIAQVVAQQAAGGVKESIVNQTAARHIGTQVKPGPKTAQP